MWKKQIKSIVLPVCLLFLLAFILFAINQVYQVYILTSAIHPTFGLGVLITLTLIMGILFLLPIYLFLKLPKALSRDKNSSEDFRRKYFRRLKRNKFLKESDNAPQSIDGFEKAMNVLNQEADAITKKTAATVFLTTAISQNGKLDAITVLATQSKMVWQIAHLYYQRPTLRELLYLYTNVGASTLIASEIEDVDIAEQFEPVIKGLLKNSAGKSIPMIGPTATLILDSLFEGSTNAFLTLRVGILTKKYCSSLESIDRKKAKNGAFKEASSLLGSLIVDSSGKVISALLKATKKAGVESVKSGIDSIKGSMNKMKEGVAKMKDKIVHSSQN